MLLLFCNLVHPWFSSWNSIIVPNKLWPRNLVSSVTLLFFLSSLLNHWWKLLHTARILPSYWNLGSWCHLQQVTEQLELHRNRVYWFDLISILLFSRRNFIKCSFSFALFFQSCYIPSSSLEKKKKNKHYHHHNKTVYIIDFWKKSLGTSNRTFTST